MSLALRHENADVCVNSLTNENEPMKTNLSGLSPLASGFLSGGLLLFGQLCSGAAVTFTVTPAAVSNTYSGTITLQVTGLTNTETVVVQKFLDANTNGVVNANDILMQQFQLTDGQASVFHDGGTAVTNFNVPGDTDGTANGQITAKLYLGYDFAQLIVGKYLFVLSSPVGHFSPVTNSFSVTNFPFAQSFAGNVVNSGTNVPNAVVILFQPSGGGQNPQVGAVANNSGSYTIKAPPGTYLLAAFKTNFVANLGVSPYVTLGVGATITTNVPVTNATQSISGNVIDVNNSSIGLAGYLVPVQSTNNLLALAFTDTNGNYNARVIPGQWKISSNAKGLVYKGYLALQNSTKVDTSAGSVSGVTIALPKATAAFYGTVKDNLGNPLPGIAIYSSDNNGNYQTDGYADANGNYVAGAIGGLNNDQWQAGVDSSAFANYNFQQGSGNISLSSGQAYRQNFTAILATNHITGHVQFNGNPVTNVQVNANANINGTNYQTQIYTDSNGNYSLNVANGSWSVSVNCNGGNNSLDSILGNGNYQCPNNQNVTINNNNATADFTVLPTTGGQIFGYIVGAYYYGVGGVNVYASDGNGDNYSTSTDVNGYYTITVGNGNWSVSVDCDQLNSLGYQCAANNYVSVSNDSVEQDFTVQLTTPQPFSFATLHGFSTTATNATNNDGANLKGGLVLAGNTLYGTAYDGGTNGNGTVFRLNTDLMGFTNLHNFAATFTNSNEDYTNSDGANPDAGLCLSNNTLYGTATYGGTNGNGTVFRLNTDLTGFTNLHNFAATFSNSNEDYTNSDGANPDAGLCLSGNTLYGTATYGGTNGNGTVFRLNTDRTGFTNLHNFAAGFTNSNGFYTNNDGANPDAGLCLSGNTLYGTATYGGTNGNGTVFRLNTDGTGFTNLHTFTALDVIVGTNSDGANPTAGLILSGNTLYGTASSGGRGGFGTVFAINTNGMGFTNLHSFTFGGDGANPTAGLILSGNTLYGTATYGGAIGYGTVFGVTTNGTVFTVLHHFTATSGPSNTNSDGANPYAGLILSGNTLYGTAQNGGPSGNGTVFSLSLVPVSPPPQLTIIRSGANVILTWPTNASGFTLQSTTNLISPAVWITNSPAPVVVNGQNTVTNPISGTKKFYRLKQ